MINDPQDDQIRRDVGTDSLDLPMVTTDDSDDTDSKIRVPDISSDDYANDPEFARVWNYLQTGNLSGDDATDKKTLLMSQFIS